MRTRITLTVPKSRRAGEVPTAPLFRISILSSRSLRHVGGSIVAGCVRDGGQRRRLGSKGTGKRRAAVLGRASCQAEQWNQRYHSRINNANGTPGAPESSLLTWTSLRYKVSNQVIPSGSSRSMGQPDNNRTEILSFYIANPSAGRLMSRST